MKTLQLTTQADPTLVMNLKVDLATDGCDIYTIMDTEGVYDLNKYPFFLGRVMNIGEIESIAVANQLKLTEYSMESTAILVEEGGKIVSKYGFALVLETKQIYANKEFTDRFLIQTQTLGDVGIVDARFRGSILKAPNRSAALTLNATDSEGNDVTAVIREGEEIFWGPPGGFPLLAEYKIETDWTAKFDTPGNYTLVFELISDYTGYVYTRQIEKVFVAPEIVEL